MAEQQPPRDEEQERRQVEQHSAPPARVVHTVVAEQGEEELGRPVSSLFWSGIAAGVAIMASVSLSGAFDHYLPQAGWRELIVELGYPLGFLIIIIGRLQLFTEQTIVAVLPFAKEPSWHNLARVARLWTVVLLGNLLGSLGVAALVVFGRVQPTEVLSGMIAVSAKLLSKTPLEVFLHGIPAGFLIASIAWIRSAQTESGFWVIIAVTYAIAACGFAHVVVGTAETGLLLWSGAADIGWALGTFIIPALAGNIIGGTGLFAVLAHAQAKDEV
jgi:formate/nitrite transporter FocA (FNT family)